MSTPQPSLVGRDAEVSTISFVLLSVGLLFLKKIFIYLVVLGLSCGSRAP